jgi:HEAT repeat protein
MRFPLPRPRLRLRTLTVLVALVALSLWVGLNLWSPTRRLGHRLRADQPVFIRREAASSLGRDIPFWEVDNAVGMLIGALDDPSPRVREYAGVGLSELGPRASKSIAKLITVLLNDEDRWVRYSAAHTLGFVIEASSTNRGEAVMALTRALVDTDSDVRLSAAEALVKIGEAQAATETLLTACGGTDLHLRDRARLVIREAKDRSPYVGALERELRNKDGKRRDEALRILMIIGSPREVRSALASVLDVDDPELQQWAAEHLRQLMEPTRSTKIK